MYLSEATTQSNLKIALSVKNLTSCKHWACCLRKMVEHWEEVKTGDFLPLPISLPFLRLPRRLSLQLQAHLSEFRGNFLRKSRYPARKSHFSSLDSDSTAKMSVPSSQKWTCSQVRKLCTYRPTQLPIMAGNHHIHGQRNYTHVVIQIQAFRRKPKKLNFYSSRNFIHFHEFVDLVLLKTYKVGISSDFKNCLGFVFWTSFLALWRNVLK